MRSQQEAWDSFMSGVHIWCGIVVGALVAAFIFAAFFEMQGCANAVEQDEPVDVATESLTLVDSFTFINSENGAEIFRSPGGWFPLRCFLMSQGSTTINNYWVMAGLGGTFPGATGTHANVQWRATPCDSTKCSLTICNLNGSCLSDGTLYYTADSHTIFATLPGTDGFQQITCKDNGGGFPGHPILKRYQ